MILRMKRGVSAPAVQQIRARIEGEGLRVFKSTETLRSILAVVDKVPGALSKELSNLPEVEEVAQPKAAWRLIAREFRDSVTRIKLGKVEIGPETVVVIAGPCSVEGTELMEEAARSVVNAGAHILRGGAFKPRTSPYAFQGFGVEGLRQLKDAGDKFGLPVLTEIMDASDLPAFLDHDIDCLQIGARNMQNFRLLKAVAQAGKAVVLKRGLSATVEEWLYAAEYLAAGGCQGIILCERGIRTFETATRNTLDLTVLPLLAEMTHLPVIVDPSHAAGIARLVAPLSRASLAAGAAGVAVEVHPRPSEARSDGPQALLPAELTSLVADARVQAAVSGRRLA
ncbi:MAG: 3-deoxy-7-phosphoheptulonate synthase [Planctomycetota bacterium]|jgi:3-deoxy-7-phosphoheptulonate synthase